MFATSVIGASAQLLLLGAFGWSALQKAVPGRSVRPVLSQMGFGPALARIVAYCVVALEGAAAVILALAPGEVFAYLIVLALAVSFAAAGGWALVAGRHVQCGCFGAQHDRPLGRWQIGLLPVWLGLCAVASAWVEPWSAQAGAAVLAWFVIAAAVVSAARVMNDRRNLRWDRWATPAPTAGPATGRVGGGRAS